MLFYWIVHHLVYMVCILLLPLSIFRFLSPAECVDLLLSRVTNITGNVFHIQKENLVGCLLKSANYAHLWPQHSTDGDLFREIPIGWVESDKALLYVMVCWQSGFNIKSYVKWNYVATIYSHLLVFTLTAHTRCNWKIRIYSHMCPLWITSTAPTLIRSLNYNYISHCLYTNNSGSSPPLASVADKSRVVAVTFVPPVWPSHRKYRIFRSGAQLTMSASSGWIACTTCGPGNRPSRHHFSRKALTPALRRFTNGYSDWTQSNWASNQITINKITATKAADWKIDARLMSLDCCLWNVVRFTARQEFCKQFL